MAASTCRPCRTSRPRNPSWKIERPRVGAVEMIAKAVGDLSLVQTRASAASVRRVRIRAQPLAILAARVTRRRGPDFRVAVTDKPTGREKKLAHFDHLGDLEAAGACEIFPSFRRNSAWPSRSELPERQLAARVRPWPGLLASVLVGLINILCAVINSVPWAAYPCRVLEHELVDLMRRPNFAHRRPPSPPSPAYRRQMLSTPYKTGANW